MSDARHLLLVDVGNTQMVFGIHRGGQLVACWRISSGRQSTADELAWQLHGMFAQERIDPAATAGIMVASVVPHLDAVLAGACERICGQAPAFVGSPEVRTAMAVDYKNPREVGADRIVNAVAAREFYGAPVIVMDCGTATTFDIVSPEGHYAGGLIIPGMEIALEALTQRTAKLPEVSLARSETLIGRDTATSMQAGSYWAAVDGLNGIVRRLRQLPGYAEAPLIATGGLSAVIRPDLENLHDWRPHLTLEGLHLLARRHFGEIQT